MYSCFFDFCKNATPEQKKAFTELFEKASGRPSDSVAEGVIILEVMARFHAAFQKLPKDVQEQAIEWALKRAEARESAE